MSSSKYIDADEPTSTPSEILSSLTESLSTVELSFEPLFDSDSNKSWSDTLDTLNGKLDRAKMNVLISYAINDLLWVYLKLRGIDPSTHDVSKELDRIQTYYGKIRAIDAPETQRPQLNTAAAKRFIQSSIPKSQHLPNLPVNSASLIAQEQASRAVAGAEEEESLKRLGKSNRFRFIAKDGETEEKIIPGTDIQEEDEGEGIDDIVIQEDEGEGEDEDVDMLNEGGGEGDEAENFLKDLDNQIQQDR